MGDNKAWIGEYKSDTAKQYTVLIRRNFPEKAVWAPSWSVDRAMSV